MIQVCKKDTKRIYAMKVMNKKTIVEKNDTEHIKAGDARTALRWLGSRRRARRPSDASCRKCGIRFS